MRFWTIISVIGLMLSGCAEDTPSRIQACEGSNVKNCSPVIYFLPDSDEVTPYGQQRLDWSVEKMQRWPEKKMLITGHAYEWGGEEYNMELSKRRARAVGQYLVQKGVDPRRIRVRYLGNAEPVCQKTECLNLNRRAVVDMYNL